MTTEAQRAQKTAYARRWRDKNRDRLRAYQLSRIEIHRQSSRDTQRRLTMLANEFKDKPCMDCGVKYPPFVMDFDHRDPGTKVAHVGRLKHSRSRAALLAEIAKCDVVCSNCHRFRTFTNAGGH